MLCSLARDLSYLIFLPFVIWVLISLLIVGYYVLIGDVLRSAANKRGRFHHSTQGGF